MVCVALPTETRALFAEKLQAIRKQLGLSSNRLAQIADVDQSLLSKIERGKRQPTDDVIARLAPHLGVTYEEMKAWAERDRLTASLGEDAVERLFRYEPPASFETFAKMMGELAAYLREIHGLSRSDSVSNIDEAEIVGNVAAFMQSRRGKYPLKLMQDALLDFVGLLESGEFHEYYLSRKGAKVEDIKEMLLRPIHPGQTERAEEVRRKLEEMPEQERNAALSELQARRKSRPRGNPPHRQ